MLLSWFPMLLLIGVWVFFMRQMQSGGGKAMGFGKSRARLLTEKHGRVTFDDVAGIDEAKEELEEIVEFLKDPQKFQRLGGRIPKGVLLVGPPGTGKTLLARAIAGEANVPFFTISGSDFVEMFVGVGASRVRDMFEQGKKNAPCIIFIDEIDAVGRHRGAGLGGGNDEREQTLNQLLVEMDGFESNEGVILIAATNRPDVLDPALLRPGRFDRQVVVPNPDVLGREKILQVHMRKVRIGPDVDAEVIARGTPGFSGADLANLVNEAALLAARAGKRMVTMDDFEAAKDKVMMGAERRSMVMTEDEKRLTAYHEAGHALVGFFVAGLRSGAQGDDHPARPRARPGDAPAGRRPDLAIAREAECRTGDGDGRPRRRGADLRRGQGHHRRRRRHRAGDRRCAPHGHRVGHERQARPDRLWREQQEVFLGHSVTQTKNVSEATARQIDAEIRGIIDDGYGTRQGDHLPRTSTGCTISPRACWSTRRCRARRSARCCAASRCPKSPPPEGRRARRAPSGGKRGSVPTTAPPPGRAPAAWSRARSRAPERQRHLPDRAGRALRRRQTGWRFAPRDARVYLRPLGLLRGTPRAGGRRRLGAAARRRRRGVRRLSRSGVRGRPASSARAPRRRRAWGLGWHGSAAALRATALERRSRRLAAPSSCRRPAAPAGPLVMGIVNVTPDSFSDGGRNLEPAAAIARGHAMPPPAPTSSTSAARSTRPGAAPVPPRRRSRRVMPVVRALAARGVLVSIDTRNAAVMRAALDAGARIVNDITALRHDPESLRGRRRERPAGGADAHAGRPATMQQRPHYADVPLDVVRSPARAGGRPGARPASPRAACASIPASASARRSRTIWRF